MSIAISLKISVYTPWFAAAAQEFPDSIFLPRDIHCQKQVMEMNQLWAFMLLLGLGYGVLTGRGAQVTEAVLSGAADGVELCLTMLGVMALWTGIMEIGEKGGLIRSITRRLGPLMRFLFPGIPQGHPALTYISTNFVANFLGLGWASTPAGLAAMRSLAELNPEKNGRASRDMCTFLILNISSLQLLPMTMIAYRQQYGSASPASIVGPAILATAASTGAAVIFCKVMGSRKTH